MITQISPKPTTKSFIKRPMASLFGKFILNQLADKVIKDTLSKRSFLSSFISEIKKEKVVGLVSDRFGSMAALQSQDGLHRNLLKMQVAFTHIAFFKKFFSLHQIDDVTLRAVCNAIDYVKMKGDDYLFRKGDHSDKFYGILKGKISIRRPDDILSLQRETKSKGAVEVEVCVLGPGDYFGDWGLLEQKTRAASAVAVGETSLFALSAKDFAVTIDKCLRKSQLCEREFLETTIRPIKESKYFNALFKTMDRMYFAKNEVVFKEGDAADRLYLIFKGEFAITKRIGVKHQFRETLHSPYDNPKSNAHCEYSYNSKTILNVTKGEIVGLEAVLNFELAEEAKAPTQTYETSLLATGDSNIIFLFNKRVLAKVYKHSIRSFLLAQYETRFAIIRKFYNKKVEMKRKASVTYREKVIKSQLMDYNLVHPSLLLSIATIASSKYLQTTSNTVHPKQMRINLSRTKAIKPLATEQSPMNKRLRSNDDVQDERHRLSLSKSTHRRSRNKALKSSGTLVEGLSSEVIRTIQNYRHKGRYNSGTMGLPLISSE